jgi:superoxide dismutase, Fe-Mn family
VDEIKRYPHLVKEENMKDIIELINIADTLDQNGLSKEADLLDNHIQSLTKVAKKDTHKCGLKESTVEQHQTLLDNYKKAMEYFEKEYKKTMRSNNEVDSPNMGALREITNNYSHNCNGVRLHEMYFQDVILSRPTPLERLPQLQDILDQLYDGGKKSFLSELKRMCKVPRNGWVLLNFCTVTKKLYLDAIDLHDEHVIAVAVPVMALDMWEHAYYADFGLDKDAYLDWFLSRMDWRNVGKRIRNLQRIK